MPAPARSTRVPYCQMVKMSSLSSVLLHLQRHSYRHAVKPANVHGPVGEVGRVRSFVVVAKVSRAVCSPMQRVLIWPVHGLANAERVVETMGLVNALRLVHQENPVKWRWPAHLLTHPLIEPGQCCLVRWIRRYQVY